MTLDETRKKLRLQIADLADARDASASDDEKSAANEAIDALQKAIRKINIAAADGLGAQVDALIEDLDAILAKNQLDAVSALSRTITKVRAELSQL